MIDTNGIDVTLIQRAWNRSTSASPNEWTPANRARGQCAVTAVVVYDCVGGRIIRTLATTPSGIVESHYANLLDNGVILDLTESQFPEGTKFAAWEERTKNYIISYPNTNRRYLTLVRRLNELRTLDTVAVS